MSASGPSGPLVLHNDNRKYFSWVFIRMSTIVTSFVYIGDEKHENCLERKRNYPSKKKLCYLYCVIEESKDELQKMLYKPGNSQ